METKNSEGPWRMVTDQVPVKVLIANKSKIIATVHGTDIEGIRTEKEVIDNAYIIAKAPLMYKMCKAMVELTILQDSGNMACETINRISELWLKIQELIKKLRLK